MNDFEQLFGPDGALAGIVDNYAPRLQQQVMAERVAQTIADSGVLVVEAGTGTGKTFAYLIPTLLSGLRIIISTGTRALQDQLFGRDLPTVARSIGRPLDITLLKGRQNYLCRHRLRLVSDGNPGNRKQDSAAVSVIAGWAALTRSGDIAEVDGVAESSPVWGAVTSTVDNCLGQSCPDYTGCHVVEARRRAQAADVVVVNHHLLLADLALKEEGFGEILPGADAIIVDEAHQLADIALQFFGLDLGSRRLLNLARDTMAECINAGLSRDQVEPEVGRFQQLVRETGAALAGADGDVLVLSPELIDSLENIRGAAQGMADRLEVIADAAAGLSRCFQRVDSLVTQLGTVLDQTGEGGVRWVERRKSGFRLRFAPFDVAGKLNRLIYSRPWAWVFTSATLAVGDDFSHFSHRNGLDDPDTCLLESPFDFENNALLYIPKNMPEPMASGYTERVVEAALPVLRATGGRAFLLFTSYRALNAARQYLAAQPDAIDSPVLVQGDAPRDRLLRQFRALGNAVLLGTGTFWEGVDVRGSALTLVVIDKLPFAAPDDPLLQARLEQLRREGRNPFLEHQLPQAVIALKQGIGRLIRDVDDWGVAMVCDPRVNTRGYGQLFLDSLPNMSQTHTLDEVLRFVRERESGPRKGASGG